MNLLGFQIVKADEVVSRLLLLVVKGGTLTETRGSGSECSIHRTHLRIGDIRI